MQEGTLEGVQILQEGTGVRKIAQLQLQRMQVLRCQECEQSFFACRVGPSGRARAREQTAVTLEGVHEQSRSCRRAREREETAPRCPDLAGGHERENRPLSRSKVSMSSPDLAGTSYFLPVPPHAEWECTRERQDTFDTHPKGFAMPHDFAKHRLPNFFNFDSPRPLPARSMCVDVSGSHASITSVVSEAHNQHPRRGQSCNTTLET